MGLTDYQQVLIKEMQEEEDRQILHCLRIVGLEKENELIRRIENKDW